VHFSFMTNVTHCSIATVPGGISSALIAAKSVAAFIFDHGLLLVRNTL